MDFAYILDEKVMTIYECSKRSNIPYSTLSDIIRGRTPIEKVSAGKLHALAATLDMTMDDLYSEMHVPERTSFETFKSQVRHEVKSSGDVRFIDETVQSDIITKYWHLEWYHEALYLMGMLDYLCRQNNLPSIRKYDKYRDYQLPETVFPMDLNIAAKFDKSLDIRRQAINEAIPEFLKYNIVEKEIRDVY